MLLSYAIFRFYFTFSSIFAFDFHALILFSLLAFDFHIIFFIAIATPFRQPFRFLRFRYFSPLPFIISPLLIYWFSFRLLRIFTFSPPLIIIIHFRLFFFRCHCFILLIIFSFILWLRLPFSFHFIISIFRYWFSSLSLFHYCFHYFAFITTLFSLSLIIYAFLLFSFYFRYWYFISMLIAISLFISWYFLSLRHYFHYHHYAFTDFAAGFSFHLLIFIIAIDYFAHFRHMPLLIFRHCDISLRHAFRYYYYAISPLLFSLLRYFITLFIARFRLVSSPTASFFTFTFSASSAFISRHFDSHFQLSSFLRFRPLLLLFFAFAAFFSWYWFSWCFFHWCRD